MECDFEEVITRNMVALQNTLIAGEVFLAHLLQDGILDPDLCDEIRAAGLRRKRVAELLKILPCRGPNAKASFLKALNETEQGHIVKILKNEDEELHRKIKDFEERLSRNRVDLTKSLKVDEVINFLLQDGILDEELYHQIKSTAGGETKKAAELLNILPCRGPETENCFIKALQETNQSHVVDILKSQRPEQQESTQHAEQQPSSQIGITEANEFDDSNPLIRFEIQPRSVEETNRIYSEVRNYPMKNQPSGRAVILNIQYTGAADLKKRLGADVDQANLENLLEKLGFTVNIWTDCDRKKVLMKHLEAEQQHADHAHGDAFILIIMGYGDGRNMFMDSGEHFPICEILRHFNEVNCPALSGKPKVVFIQSCNDQNEESVTFVPRGRDFYLAYAAAPGYFAIRNSKKGSWFINSVVKVFAASAHKLDLDSLMTEVARILTLRGREKMKEPQVHSRVIPYDQCCCVLHTFTKRLFFLPTPTNEL